MASGWSDYGRVDAATNGASGGTFRIIAVTAEPSDVADTAHVSDISDEVTESGYSRQDLTNVTVTRDGTAHRAVITADQISLGEIATGETIRGVWFYRQVGASPVDSVDVPWVYIDTTDLPTNGAGLTVTPGSSGWAKV